MAFINSKSISAAKLNIFQQLRNHIKMVFLRTITIRQKASTWGGQQTSYRSCATKGMVSTESSVLMNVISVMSVESFPYRRQRMVP